MKPVHALAMKGGHFFTEENPDDTAAPIKQFLPVWNFARGSVSGKLLSQPLPNPAF
jgi:hypothetical protein